MKRQLEVEKEERETRQKNEEYVAIPESEYRRGVVEAINRKRAESGMSPCSGGHFIRRYFNYRFTENNKHFFHMMEWKLRI